MASLRDLSGVLASVACDPARSRGRKVHETEAETRSPFQRDRDRIIHSSAFRRLKSKTQVFVASEGDTYRTRLTHSLEVAQVARSLCRFLGLNEDLAEALALAHDLGHTCFGHAGEDVLQECMAPFNGFDHNAQSLRIVTKLEHRYAGFDGLNLTWECLEGLVKHNGPLLDTNGDGAVPLAIVEYNAGHDLELATWPSAEAQVAAVSDDIAYNAHDLDDGLRAGLFTFDDVLGLPLVGPIFKGVAEKYPNVAQSRLIHEALSGVISAMANDVIAESARRYAVAKPKDADGVRALDQAMVGFSGQMAEHDKSLKEFLFAHMYRHNKVIRMTSKARRVVRELFELFLSEPELLPEDWRAGGLQARSPKTARRVADYIAGMTDRFALDEHSRLFDPAVKP